MSIPQCLKTSEERKNMLWEVSHTEQHHSHALKLLYFGINLADRKCHYYTSKRQKLNHLKSRKQKNTLKIDALELKKAKNPSSSLNKGLEWHKQKPCF